MTSDEPGHDLDTLSADWDKIDDLLSEIARLSKSDIPPAEFYARALDATLRGLAAAGGAFWSRGEGARGRILVQNLPADGWPASLAAARMQLIGLVLQSARSGILPPGCDASGDAPAGNPTGYVLLVSPWMIDGQAAGVIEVLQPPGVSAEVENGYIKLLEAIGELVADYQRSGQIRELRERLQWATRLENFSHAIHAQVELQPTAYAIVNEGRQLLNCDRLSLLVARGRRLRVAAISGVDTIHSRAKVVELLEALAAAAVTVDQPLWFPDEGPPKPPQVEAAVSGFLDDSHARSLAVLPLKLAATEGQTASQATSKTVGVLVVERFYGPLDERLRLDRERICTPCALAVRNARELAELPLAGVLRKLRWLKSASRLTKIVLIVAMFAGIVAALVLVPADFNIAAHGELQPQKMRDVFARADGLISELNAEQGQKVQENALLARLRRPQMDLEFKQVLGELNTARKRLTAVEAERLRLARDTEEQQRQFDQLTAQSTELTEVILNLEQQHKILLEKQEEMEIRSPMTGEVLTWNVRQSLDARPVHRGQVLMTIGDLSGPWQVELKIRDRDVAHLLAAQRDLGAGLAVTYWLSSDPAQRLHGTIRSVALRTETPEGQEPTLAVVVDPAPGERPQLTAGATVSASIACGRRAIGYVWLHDFLDTVRGWMWF